MGRMRGLKGWSKGVEVPHRPRFRTRLPQPLLLKNAAGTRRRRRRGGADEDGAVVGGADGALDPPPLLRRLDFLPPGGSSSGGGGNRWACIHSQPQQLLQPSDDGDDDGKDLSAAHLLPWNPHQPLRLPSPAGPVGVELVAGAWDDGGARLRLPPWPILVIRVLLHVDGPQPLRLVDKRPLFRLTQQFPLRPEPFRNLRVVHLRILLRHLTPLTPRPHHESVHWSLHPVHILVLTTHRRTSRRRVVVAAVVVGRGRLVLGVVVLMVLLLVSLHHVLRVTHLRPHRLRHGGPVGVMVLVVVMRGDHGGRGGGSEHQRTVGVTLVRGGGRRGGGSRRGRGHIAVQAPTLQIRLHGEHAIRRREQLAEGGFPHVTPCRYRRPRDRDPGVMRTHPLREPLFRIQHSRAPFLPAEIILRSK
ncbi:hypothetical protein J437_LFUL019747 [Ladona fulva]|nr:hypothetical protein J437_LFUL019747 [Ladona fulva]